MNELEEKDPSSLDDADLFMRLSDWCKKDQDHWQEWRKEAELDYDFVAGKQYSDDERRELINQKRPPVVFNRIAPIIDTISGTEIQNRQEIKYYPRELGDVKVSELYTSAAQWFREQCQAEDEESDAFLDTLTCGLGFTETRLDFTDNPDGDPVVERVDPLEMIVDCGARKANLLDARRMFRLKDMRRSEAKELFPDANPATLDAGWARLESQSRQSSVPSRNYRQDASDISDDDTVTIVHAQWVDLETIYYAIDPATGQRMEVEEDEAVAIRKQAMELGVKSPLKTGTKRIWKQAFLGTELLEPSTETLSEKCSWCAITGKRDRNRGTWYGVVRGMRDPQQWANKWMLQAMHILNTTAKGGILAETGVFLNQDEAQKSYARPDAITWVQDGAISRNAIMPKPGGAMPAGFFELMQFAVSSVRDVSGINLEMIGAREGNQPGILEYQRKQAALTVMARFFDSLRRYRKLQGTLLLSLIQDYLSDGRLVRIVGDEEAQYAPLVKNQGVKEFDIIVDEAPSAPNQKEQTWQVVQQMLPVVGSMLTPELWGDILQYSPLPSSLVEKIKKRVADGQDQQQQSPEMMKAQAAIQAQQAKSQADIETQQAKASADAQLKQMRIQADAEAARQKAAVEVEVMHMKAQNELQIAQQEAANDLQARREEMMLEAQLNREKMALLGTAGPGDETNISRE